jgi:hypothetical protein
MGFSVWRLVDLCAYTEQTYEVRFSQWGLSCLLKRLNLSRQKTRPSHPKSNPAAKAASKRKLPSKLQGIAAEHPDARLQLWCQDEARFGQKGRTTRAWYERGVRPPGEIDRRFESWYLFAACRPGTDETFALALPRVSAAAMEILLEHLSHQLAPGIHVVLVLDQAGWHDVRPLQVPETITLLPLLSASPQLNPVERVWL